MAAPSPPFASPEVEAAFARFPPGPRRALLALRARIFSVAARTEGVGRLEETLKWGEPAYLTSETRSGTTVRLGYKAAQPDVYRMYVPCSTTLVDEYRARFAGELTFEGDRAVLLPLEGPLPRGPVDACIAAALTYKRDKRR